MVEWTDFFQNFHSLDESFKVFECNLNIEYKNDLLLWNFVQTIIFQEISHSGISFNIFHSWVQTKDNRELCWFLTKDKNSNEKMIKWFQWINYWNSVQIIHK